MTPMTWTDVCSGRQGYAGAEILYYALGAALLVLMFGLMGGQA